MSSSMTLYLKTFLIIWIEFDQLRMHYGNESSIHGMQPDNQLDEFVGFENFDIFLIANNYQLFSI